MSITIINVNDPPFFLNDPLTKANATEGRAYSDSIAGDADDPDVGDMLTFSKIDGPSWLGVDSSGTLSGTPGRGDGGVNIFTVRATDAAGAHVNAAMNIPVVKAFSSNAQHWRLY